MSCMISFASAYSRCEELEASDSSKMKKKNLARNGIQITYVFPQPAYEADELIITQRYLTLSIYWNSNALTFVNYIKFYRYHVIDEAQHCQVQ